MPKTVLYIAGAMSNEENQRMNSRNKADISRDPMEIISGWREEGKEDTSKHKYTGLLKTID